ncbi:DUF3560 domain-containing protein [Pseudonocardia sp. WMMC193]|uniref:DUF3560 domain-containing protein n=1 Tax=Pseudonocardia sp. WMMC193 TaxID=2911965 RepID=UPI001F2FF85E|nr:DUF3560 domain-containing protein [Pseudonocardia sp. WMMC193]MCF7547334.1 DUF3560 domain-containing protein [Pseudonocardia sp. WMMC193]
MTPDPHAQQPNSALRGAPPKASPTPPPVAPAQGYAAGTLSGGEFLTVIGSAHRNWVYRDLPDAQTRAGVLRAGSHDPAQIVVRAVRPEFHPGVTATQTAFRIVGDPDHEPEPTFGPAQPRRQLLIEHTYAEGTCLEGVERADDLYRTLRSLGWLARRSVGDYRLQHSQDRPAKLGAIDRTVQALESAGFSVEVRIDTTARSMAKAETERSVRAEQRADRLTARSDRLATEAAGREEAANRVFDHIPLGQPLLTDHHSYGRDSRRRERARANMARSVELDREAGQTAEAAATAAAHMRHRHNPETVANRIRTLTAELNRYMRERAELPTDTRITDEVRARRDAELAEREEHTRSQLAHWQQVRAEQITNGQATDYRRDDISRGDLIRYQSGWYVVVRANAKSVSVPSPIMGGGATHTVRYEHLRDHITPDSPRWAAIAVEAVLSARLMANRGELTSPEWKRVEASVHNQLTELAEPAETRDTGDA